MAPGMQRHGTRGRGMAPGMVFGGLYRVCILSLTPRLPPVPHLTDLVQQRQGFGHMANAAGSWTLQGPFQLLRALHPSAGASANQEGVGDRNACGPRDSLHGWGPKWLGGRGQAMDSCLWRQGARARERGHDRCVGADTSTTPAPVRSESLQGEAARPQVKEPL